MSNKIGAIHVVLNTKEVITFVEEVESAEDFVGLIEQFGADVANDLPLQGKDEHDDEVFIPHHSVSYIRGVLR